MFILDNVDTKGSLEAVRELISSANVYMRDNKELVNAQLLEKCAVYVTDLLRIFGAIKVAKGSIGFPLSTDGGSGDGNVRIL